MLLLSKEHWVFFSKVGLIALDHTAMIAIGWRFGDPTRTQCVLKRFDTKWSARFVTHPALV